MINVQNISSKLAIMPDEALKQFAAMHKEDPYTFSLAMFESNRRKQVRSQPPPQMDQTKVVDKELADMGIRKELPENLGIARLPVDMNMASGGIVAFDDGGMTHYAKGGDAGSDPKLAYRQYAITQANKMGLDPALVDTIFQIESQYNPNAVSPKGAVGIGQLMPETSEARNLDRKDRKDPYKNIDASLQEMKSLQTKYNNDTSKIAAAYNWGQGNLDNHLKNNDGTINTSKLPKETQSYLKKLTDLIPLSSANAETVTPTQPAQPAPPQEADRSVTGQLKSIGQGIAGIPSAIGNVIAPEGAGGYTPGTRNFFERSADVVGIPEGFQREFSNTLNALGGFSGPAQIPAKVGKLSAAAQAAREADDAAAALKATQAEAKVANLRLPPAVPKAQGIEALSEEERVRRGLGATTPVVPAKPLPNVNDIANMSEAERLKLGFTPRGKIYPLGPDAIKMQQELLARRGQVGNIGAKAPSGIEALTTSKAAPTKFPLSQESLEMSQKLKAARDAQALRNLRADEQAAEAARKAVTEVADASKAAEGVEMANAAKAANVVNKVIVPANQAIKTAREVQATRNLDTAVDQIQFPSETKTDAVTPPYRPNETRELLKKYPAPTSVKPPEGGEVKPTNVVNPPSPLEKIEDLNKGVGRRDAGGNLSPKAETAIATAAKDAVPKTEENSSWSKDDWVQFGLALMAGKSSNALTNVGEAGLSLLASKQARELKNRELDLYKQVHMEKPGEREKAIQKLMDANPSLTYEQALARYAELTTATGEREKAVKQIMDERKVPYSKALEIYTDTIESPYKMAAVLQRAEAASSRNALGEAKLGESSSEAAARISKDNLKNFYIAKKDLDERYPSVLRSGSSDKSKARQAAYEAELLELRAAFDQAPSKVAPALPGPPVKVLGVKP